MRGDIVVTLRMCHLQTPNRPTVRALCSQLHGCMCGVVALLTQAAPNQWLNTTRLGGEDCSQKHRILLQKTNSRTPWQSWELSLESGKLWMTVWWFSQPSFLFPLTNKICLFNCRRPNKFLTHIPLPFLFPSDYLKDSKCSQSPSGCG